MFDAKENETLSARMHETGEASFSVGAEGETLCFASTRPTTRRETVTSADSGSFLPRGGADGLTPLAGSTEISGGELLGYLCRGAVRLLVTAPTSGRIVGARPEAGAMISPGDTLFTMEVPT